MAAILLVLNAACLEIVEALGRTFVIRTEKWNNTLVDFNTGDDVTLFQQLDERRAILGLLVEGFVKKNNSGDVLSDNILKRGSKELNNMYIYYVYILSRIIQKHYTSFFVQIYCKYQALVN